MAEVYTNPLEKNDTNEANLARVQADSALEASVCDLLKQWLAENPLQPVAVIQIDMDKSVEIRKCGISYKLKVLTEVSELLSRFNREDCRVIPHGTRDDITILRKINADFSDAAQFVSDILNLLEETPFGHGMDKGPFHITYSAGIAFYPFHGHSATQLLELADGAVRWAKNHGRNTWSIAESGYNYIQTGEVDSYRLGKLLQLSCKTGLSVEELLREGYEALFQKHSAFYRFCCQEETEAEPHE